MTQSVLFAPLIPMVLIWVLAGIAAGMLALALWRGLPGWPLRLVAAAVLLVALANPSLQTEVQKPLSDIVIVVVDESASNRLGGRPRPKARRPWRRCRRKSRPCRAPRCG